MSRRRTLWSFAAVSQLLACSPPPAPAPSNEPQPVVTAPSLPTTDLVESATPPEAAAPPIKSAAPPPKSGSPPPTYESYFRPEYHPPREVAADGFILLHDFSRRAGMGSSLNGLETGALVERFPHPEAKPGATCRANDPNEPQKKIEAPFATAIAGSFSASGAKEMAFLIDYCPTGLGQPRTRRVVVLDGDKLVLDHVLPAGTKGEWADLAVDIDGDGREEILATSNIFRPGRSTLTEATLLRVAPGKLAVLGAWSVTDHCSVSYKKPDTVTSHTISYRLKGGVPSFRDVAKTEPCFYPPAPP